MRRRKPYVSHEEMQIEEFRRRPKMALEYLNVCFELAFEDDDPELALLAMADVTKAFGIEKIAKGAGIRRESLHRMLSKRGNPEWKSLFRVLKALQVRPRLEPISAARH